MAIFKRFLEDDVNNNKEIAKVALETKFNIQKGMYPKWEVDSVFQQWEGRGNKIDLVNAWAWAWIHGLIHSGELFYVTIGIGEEPGQDKATEENNRKLRNINRSFKAWFKGGAGDCDGNLSWEEDIILENICPDCGRDERIKINKNGNAPLEVGFTEGATSLQHLLMSGGSHNLARWPYNHKYIYLFALKDSFIQKINKAIEI